MNIFFTIPLMLSAIEIAVQPSSVRADDCYSNLTFCNSIISITNTGASITPTGVPLMPNGSFSLADIAVINNSHFLIKSIDVTGFYVSRSSSYDSTNYYPDRTNISFLNEIIPGQRNSFSVYDKDYSLGDLGNISKGASCANAINNTLAFSLTDNTGQGTYNFSRINAYFTPNGYSLREAANICGFTGFNWQQTITFDNINQLHPISDSNPTPPVPYSDPPAGGWSYEQDNYLAKTSYPYYWNNQLVPGNFFSIASHMTNDRLDFTDGPEADNVAIGQRRDFLTKLVGVYADGSPKSLNISFNWSSNYDRGDSAIPNSKSGGIFNCSVCFNSIVNNASNLKSLLSSNDTSNLSLITDYEYNGGFTVTHINGIATGPTFEANFIAAVPEPSQLVGTILSSLVSFYLTKKRKKYLNYLNKH